MELLAGNATHVETPLVQIEAALGGSRRDLVFPARDTLFTSGTLGRYSHILHSVMESHTTEPAKTAAD